MNEINLELFDVKIKIMSKFINDIENIKFVFRKYLMIEKPLENEVDIIIKMDSKENKSVDIRGALSCFYRNESNKIYYKLSCDEEYREWISTNTFLPPIDTDLYLNKFLILHGVGLYKDNKTYIFLGGNFSGKSSILLYGLMNGYKCISDDLLFYDIKKRKIIPYYKPAGIRSTSKNISLDFLKLYNSINDIEHKDFLNKVNGVTTRIFHLDDLFKDPFVKFEVPIDNIFLISDFSKNDLNFGERIELIEKGCCNSNIADDIKFESIYYINSKVKDIRYIKKKGDLNELFKTL